MSITTDNRFDSYIKVDKTKLYGMIINTLKENNCNSMTAREIAIVLNNKGLIINNDRQAVQPRLTELVDKNIVEVVGKKFDSITKRNVAVYSLVLGDTYAQNDSGTTKTCREES